MTDVNATITELDAASRRSGHGPRAATDDVLLRLALWLAEVAAESALAAPAPGSEAPRDAGRAGEPPVVEPAR